MKEPQVTQTPCLVVELLALGLLRHSHEDVAGLLLSHESKLGTFDFFVTHNPVIRVNFVKLIFMHHLKAE